MKIFRKREVRLVGYDELLFVLVFFSVLIYVENSSLEDRFNICLNLELKFVVNLSFADYINDSVILEFSFVSLSLEDRFNGFKRVEFNVNFELISVFSFYKKFLKVGLFFVDRRE